VWVLERDMSGTAETRCQTYKKQQSSCHGTPSGPGLRNVR
jgi:hypothetical protein